MDNNTQSRRLNGIPPSTYCVGGVSNIFMLGTEVSRLHPNKHNNGVWTLSSFFKYCYNERYIRILKSYRVDGHNTPLTNTQNGWSYDDKKINWQLVKVSPNSYMHPSYEALSFFFWWGGSLVVQITEYRLVQRKKCMGWMRGDLRSLF